MTAKRAKSVSPLPLFQLIFATLVLAFGYLYTVSYACLRGTVDCFYTPLHLTEFAPYRYRLLAPAIPNLLTPNSSPLVMLLVDAAVHTVLIAIALPALFLWLRRWMSSDRAVNGILIMALCFTVAFHYYPSFSTSIIEFAVLCALLANLEKSFAICIVLVIVDSFNRETALMLVAIYGVWHGWAGKYRTLTLFAIWAAITGGLHLVLGAAPHIYGLEGTLSLNLDSLPRAVIFNLSFIPLWIMTARKYRHSPPRLKRLVWVAAIYGLSVLVGASWEEVRVQLPILPLVMPIILSDGLTRIEPESEPAEETAAVSQQS